MWLDRQHPRTFIVSQQNAYRLSIKVPFKKNIPLALLSFRLPEYKTQAGYLFDKVTMIYFLLKMQDLEESSLTQGEPKETNDVPGEKQHAGRQGNQKQHNPGKDDSGKRQIRSGNTERDRSYKDKYKAKIANHNRKTAAAKKYSKGMM